MLTLETSDEANWREAEKFWIASFRLAGADLCNLADGGKGRDGYRLTDEHKRKISESGKGRKLSEKAKEILRLAKLGKPRPDLIARNVARAKLSQDKVAEIKSAVGKTVRQLAHEYAVSSTLIWLIRNDKRRVISSHKREGVVS
jgi:hypothetical protein